MILKYPYDHFYTEKRREFMIRKHDYNTVSDLRVTQ